MLKPGQKIVLIDRPDDITIRGPFTVEKASDYWVNVKEHTHPFATEYCFPVEYKDELQKVLTTRAELKKQFNESIKLLFELRNKISRESN